MLAANALFVEAPLPHRLSSAAGCSTASSGPPISHAMWPAGVAALIS
jgi:hypothetical protein